MVECFRAGMIIRDLAEKFSISPSRVKRILRRAGIGWVRGVAEAAPRARLGEPSWRLW